MNLEELAVRLNAKVWLKGDLKRIYLNNKGWNTKKMSTKTYIWQNEKGEFVVNCRIECPSQHPSWIDSQEEKVRNDVKDDIDRILFREEHPDVDYDEYIEEQEAKAREAAEKKAPDLAAAKPKLLAIRFLQYAMRSGNRLFENLLDYFSETAYSDGLFSAQSYSHNGGVGFPKSENITEITFRLRCLDFAGNRTLEETATIPVTKNSSSKKYNYYVVDESTLADYLPASYIKMWEETKAKTAILNRIIQENIDRLTEDVQEFIHLLSNFSYSAASTDENHELVKQIRKAVEEEYK